MNRRWGWLAFNSGSTYGVTGDRWQFAARAAVATMISSMGGGLIGLGFSLTNPNGIDILSQINGVLGALVAVTGTCSINVEKLMRKTKPIFFKRLCRVRWVFPLPSLGGVDSRDGRWLYHMHRNASVRQTSHRRSCRCSRHSRCVYSVNSMSNFYKFLSRCLSIGIINTRVRLKYRRKWYLGSYRHRFIC